MRKSGPVNRIWAFTLVLLPIVIGIGQLFIGSGAGPVHDLNEENATVGPEQLVFMLQYLGADYELAVQDGQVINQFEFEEMVDFSRSILEQYQDLKPEDTENMLPQLRGLQDLVEAKADRESVQSLAARLVKSLSGEFNVTAFPATPPDVSAGRRIYEENCLRCHGVTGAGDGPSVTEEEMDPRPRSFRDQRLNAIAPYQAYNAVTFGVEGTAMPAHETLAVEKRWDVSFFVFTLREDFSPRRPPQGTTLNLRALATRSNLELALSFPEADEAARIAFVDYLRRYPPAPSVQELLLVARDSLKRSLDSYLAGDARRAADLSMDAYLYGIEPAETALRLVDTRMVDRLEGELRNYRMALRRGETGEIIGQQMERLMETLREAERSLRDSWHGEVLTFVQALTIILREGIEAALLVGLLLAYLARAGRRELWRFVYWGSAGGVVAGLLTWLSGRQILVSGGHREALEGFTSLLAAAVLFWVSLWIFHNLDVQRWKAYMREQASLGIKAGSGWFLASAAFLAVYREAVETALFYQALWLRSSDFTFLILAGFVTGVLLLSGFVLMWLKLGIRLNLKPFFVTSGILLGVLSVIFAGYGVRELQNIGYLNETPLTWMISLPLFEIWPVREGAVLQLGMALSFLLGWQVARRGRAPAAKTQNGRA